MGQAGYCETCKKEYANLWEHKRTKKHLAKIDKVGIEHESTEIEDISEESGVYVNSVRDDNRIDGADKTIAGIQIIDNNTIQPVKSSVDKIGEFLFSEQMMPVTTTILSALADRLNNTHNTDQEAGAIVETVGGGKIQVPNKNF